MNKHSIKFFSIVLIITWLLWLPTVIHSQWTEVPSFLLLFGMFASFTPSITGLIMLKKEKGSDFKSYFKTKFNFKFNKIWLLILLIFPLQGGLTLFMTRLADPDFVVQNPIPLAMFPLVFLQILFIGGALGEEFGWRGFVYDKLEAKHGIFLGTLILGLIWSLWHLPLFFMTGTVQSNLPIWQFMIQNTVLAYFYTWIYRKTDGNILLMILLHAVMNTSAAMFPYWQSNTGRYIGLALMLIMLAVIGLVDRKAFKTA